MALADHFDEADVLDTLSWVNLSFKARVARLANLYLDKEEDIVDAHRNYKGPTLGTVRVFVKSIYSPPRGQGGVTFQAVLKEIPGQLKIREERSKYRPWTFKKQKSLEKRRNKVARHLYTIWKKKRWGSRGEEEKQNPNCVAITRLGECKLVVDGGGYHSKARIYIRHIATGKVKIVVVQGGNTTKSVSWTLMRLVPQAYRTAIFGGQTIHLDFEGSGFIINGEPVPWKALKVYSGKQAHKTQGEP